MLDSQHHHLINQNARMGNLQLFVRESLCNTVTVDKM